MSPSQLITELLLKQPDLYPKSPTENMIISHLTSYLSLLPLYKERQLIEKILNVVPFLELTLKSSQKLTEMKQDNETKPAFNVRDVFFFFLLDWFKNEFFNWFHTPTCDQCNSNEMAFKSNVEPSLEEKKWLAFKVELYECSKCSNLFRFPRYNHPLKLLDTRMGMMLTLFHFLLANSFSFSIKLIQLHIQGRCGEWRSCFAAICTALDYDVRLVDDCQDHVWNEVYLSSQKRWVHCDSGENALDTPLMYELGWNKKVLFCLAVSHYECQDVTWRYTNRPIEVSKSRSKLIRETWLSSFLLSISKNLQNRLKSETKTFLFTRRVQELSQFLYTPNSTKSVKPEELKGRRSGSLAWRLKRGEVSNNLIENNYIFKKLIYADNKQAFRIIYRSASDEYICGQEKIKGWNKCTFKYQNINRKVEHDWKMSYLARNEGSSFSSLGLLVYAINLPDNYCRIKIFVNIELFSTGSAEIVLDSSSVSCSSTLAQGLSHAIKIKFNQENVIEKEKLQQNCDTIYLKIFLSNGEGDNSWQHAQIFRQSLTNNVDNNSMEIVVEA